MNNDEFSSWAIVLGIIALGAYCAYRDRDATSGGTFGTASISEPSSISRYDAISEHWDEIKEYVNGTETVEACSESGCYDLDAEISNGRIESLHFPNGGYQLFSADIEQDESASDVDQRGRFWEFTLDMDSAVVDEAVREWAQANGRVIQ